MGRLIDADILKEVFSRNVAGGNAYFDLIDNAPTVEAIPKADYENRLKADMVAMLTELQLEIEEVRLDRPLMSRGYECYGVEDKTPAKIRQECSDIIQEKINALRGDENDGKNNT